MTLLRVEDLHVRVSGREVLRGVDLEVGPGEVHVLMGPNGSGKSTLLRTIMGLRGYEVIRGGVYFEGEPLDGLSPTERALRGIAMLYQNPPRVGVKLGYLVRKMVEKYGGDSGIAERVGILHLLDRELHRGFSGGESKRVELALTVLQRPKLALLDEPDSGVDVDSLRVIASVINDLISRGVAVLLVTHTGGIASHLAGVDRAHVMVGGRIVCSGGFDEVFERVMSSGYAGMG